MQIFRQFFSPSLHFFMRGLRRGDKEHFIQRKSLPGFFSNMQMR